MSDNAQLDAKPTLLLLTGLLCDDEIWSDVVPSLAGEVDIKVVSFPGFSSIESMADHVLGSAPERFVLAGHSMGGRVALEVMRRAPARVLGLALLNTGIHGTAAHEAASRGRLVQVAENAGMSALAAEWLPPMLDASRQPSDPIMRRLTRMVERNTPESFAAQIQALLHRPEAESVLSAANVPVLLISGTGDRWSPPAQHAAMRDRCPRAQLTILEGAGHMSPLERPAEVAAGLAGFLARVVASAQAQNLCALDALLIRDACTRQIYRYARLNDRAAWRELAALFTDSGILYRPSEPNKPIEGRERILESLEARPHRLSLHTVSNVEVMIESTTRAYAASALVLYSAASGEGTAAITSIAVGQFHDQLVKVGDDWLFAERRGAITMRGAAPPAGI